jgi:hypothetical protein
LVAVAGSAYAADLQQAPLSNSAAPAATATPTHTRTQRYEAPPGYYQNPWMVPYTRPNYGPKPN